MSENQTPVQPSASPAQEQPIEVSEQETQEASEQVEPKSEVQKEVEKKLLKKLKLKVDGKEFEEELPFEVPEEHSEYLKKQLQLAKMGQKRAQEAAQMETAINEFMELLKTNPKAILSDPSIGLDLKQFAASIIEEEIERAKKSPEQLEKEALQEELKRLKEEKQKEREEKLKQEEEFKTQQQVEYYDNMITEAIAKSELPQGDPEVVRRVAAYMRVALEKGINLSADEIVPIVQEEMYEQLQSLVKKLGVDKAEKFLGKDILAEFKKKNAPKKAPPPTPVSKSIPDSVNKFEQKQQDDKPRQKKTFKQMFGV